MKKVLGKLFWVIIILLMALWTFEFFRIRNGKKPLFCIKNEQHLYEDGVTNVCIGLGYKVYDYNRNKLEGVEFNFLLAPEKTNKGVNRIDLPSSNDDENIEETE